MNSIQWNSPLWYVFLFLAIALGITAVLYYRSEKFNDQAVWVRRLLPSLRFVSLLLILLLLLNPLIKTIDNEEVKPTLLIARDASNSMLLNQDSMEVMSSIEALENSQLDEKYELKYLSFGSEIRPGTNKAFGEEGTDLSSVFEYAQSQYRGRNLGAIVLLTDGIFNQGINPIYSADGMETPVFSLAYGDTTTNRDLLIRNTFHNEKVYQGDFFETQIDISANQLRGESTNLRLERISPSPALIQSTEITIDSDNYFKTSSLEILADRPGIHHYVVKLDPLQGEINTQNNRMDFYVEVIDASTKILLLARAPHPDIGALQRVVEENKNYVLELHYLSDRPNPLLKDYDLIIYHDLPVANPFLDRIVDAAQEIRLPSLYISGPQTDLSKFNDLQQVVKVSPRSRQANFVQASLNSDFQKFTTDGFASFDWKNSPPIKSAFAEFKLLPGAQSLLYQRIGDVETDYPLIALNTKPYKQAVLLGSDWWKWRLFEFVRDGGQKKFDRLFTQLFQYLALAEDRRPLQVQTSKRLYSTNENILFKASLLNANYESINTPEVAIDIVDQEGRDYEYLMDRSEKGYELNIGSLPAGDYQFSASSMFSGKKLNAKGSFTIQNIKLEAYDLKARHDLLYQLAELNGASSFSPDQTDSLIAKLQISPAAKPLLYQRSTLSKLIDYRWLLFFIAFFLSLEWGLRKYFGSY
ncbi:MAG TPA: hypothetical protein VJ917_12395 [Saprospiraceae bacterium]|nr:hypothetical protein [Saprospiraceae bacterium]